MRVFVHGFSQTPMASWESVAMRLPDDALLPPIATGLDFVATAHALDLGSAEYVGYSMGGRLCLQLALDRPTRVERLVLVSASPGIADADERAARRASDEALALEVERDGVDTFLERWIAQPLFASLAPQSSGVDDRKAAYTTAALAHQLRALGQGAQPDNWARLHELRMPVLVVAGELDMKYVYIAHRMAERIPDVRVEIVPGAGHACQLERPEAVAHLLASW
jgi:2-succinyl-6-hydroxy-2,4-cyclohexadiene-1-carboxylate synthase